jgi:peptidoglycan hydrolase-like protein with peptidoglycan-binding domain
MPNKEDLRRAQELAYELAGGRYLWGGVSRRGSDSSGFMSILLNSVQDRRDVYVRRFCTGNLGERAGDLGLRSGLGDEGDFNIGVRYPFESRCGIGHVAGTIGGLNVESRGGRGVLVGSLARGAASTLFLHHFHFPIEGARQGVRLSPPPRRLVQPYPGHPHRRGSIGDNHVCLVQQRLNEFAGPGGHDILDGRPLAVDGEFGAETERVVRVFQAHRRIEVDGVVGPRTWVHLFRM